MHHILILGAGGQLGGALRRHLAGRTGLRVTARSGSARAGMPSLDVTDAAAVDREFAATRPDSVILLAGVTGPACDADPERAARVNVDGAAHVARAAAAHGVPRIVLPSTSAVYGDARPGPLDETAEPDPAGQYGRTKLEAERVTEETIRGSRTSVAVLRIFNVWGPGLAGSLVERLRSSTPESPVELVGWERFVRDYSHVDDICDILHRAAVAELPEPAVRLNVGTGVGTSNRELVALLERLGPVHARRTGDRESHSRADPARCRQVLGASPRPLASRLSR